MVDDEFVNICSWQIKLRMIFLTQINDKVVDIPEGQNDDWVFFQEYCWDLGIPKSIMLTVLEFSLEFEFGKLFLGMNIRFIEYLTFLNLQIDLNLRRLFPLMSLVLKESVMNYMIYWNIMTIEINLKTMILSALTALVWKLCWLLE